MNKKLTCSLLALSLAFSSAPALLSGTNSPIGAVDVSATLAGGEFAIHVLPIDGNVPTNADGVTGAIDSVPYTGVAYSVDNFSVAKDPDKYTVALQTGAGDAGSDDSYSAADTLVVTGCSASDGTDGGTLTNVGEFILVADSKATDLSLGAKLLSITKHELATPITDLATVDAGEGKITITNDDTDLANTSIVPTAMANMVELQYGVSSTTGEQPTDWVSAGVTTTEITGLSAGNYFVFTRIAPTGENSKNIDASEGLQHGTEITGVTAAPFEAVTDITDVPTTGTVGDTTLSGTVAPAAATNKTIVWTVKDAGATSATINGTTLTTTAAGTVEVTATITDGAGSEGSLTDFAKDYTLTITDATSTPPTTPEATVVTDITMTSSASGLAGRTLTLAGETTPAGETITWAMKAGDTTNSSISGSTLTLGSSAGTAKVTATAGDYTEDFDIAIIEANVTTTTTATPSNDNVTATDNKSSATGAEITNNTTLTGGLDLSVVQEDGAISLEVANEDTPSGTTNNTGFTLPKTVFTPSIVFTPTDTSSNSVPLTPTAVGVPVSFAVEVDTQVGKYVLLKIKGGVATVVSDATVVNSTRNTDTVNVSLTLTAEDKGASFAVVSAAALTDINATITSNPALTATEYQAMEFTFTSGDGATETAKVGSDGKLAVTGELFTGVSYTVTATTMASTYTVSDTIYTPTFAPLTWVAADSIALTVGLEETPKTDGTATITMTGLTSGTTYTAKLVSGETTVSAAAELTDNGNFSFSQISYLASTGTIYNVMVNDTFVGTIKIENDTEVTAEFEYVELAEDAPTIEVDSGTDSTITEVQLDTTAPTTTVSGYKNIESLLTLKITGTGTLKLNVTGLNSSETLVVFDTTTSTWKKLTHTEEATTPAARTTDTTLSITIPTGTTSITLAYATATTPTTTTPTTPSTTTPSTSGNTYSSAAYHDSGSVRVNGTYITELRNVLVGELVNLNNITSVNGRDVIAWYYDEAMTQEITNPSQFVITSDVIANGLFAKVSGSVSETLPDGSTNAGAGNTTGSGSNYVPSVVPSTFAKLLNKLF